MTDRSYSRIVVINSEDRLSQVETSSQFTVRILPSIVGAYKVALAYAIIPNSTYNINTTNNQLTFDDGSVVTATITPGSYNAMNLATAVAAAMTAVGGQTYTVTYNSITYHYTISAPGSFALFYADTIPNTIFPTLGYKFVNNSITGNNFVSNSAISLVQSPFFAIRVDKVPLTIQTTSGASNFGTFIINNNAAQDGSLIMWTKYQNFNEVIDININIDTLFIELRDHNGAIADINNSDWSFAMQVWYGKPPTSSC